ncbi:MAG: hypothetical protein J6T35_03380, partial [Bacteroidales bacterium]|nr:hypothetical protein [Bacteroidales bacterium]
VGYPASAFSFSGGTGTVTVPTTQTYVSGSYDPAAYIIVGKSSSQETGFYPQMGIIRLTPRDASPASGLNIKSVKVEAIGGEPMSGRFTTDYDNTSATFSPVVGQVNSYVQINAPNSSGLAFDTQFFFLVPARTYESGIRFVVTTTDNKSMTFSNPNSYEVGATATLSVKSPPYVPSEIAAPTLTAISSSSIGVAWSGANASNNTAKKWKIHVYSDSACNTEVRTITIPADAACWTDVGWDTTVAPALVVGRLSQGTTYYVKVEDVANAIVSPQASVTTDAFTLKAMPASIAAGATGLIYAEDFSEVGWGSAWFSNYNAGGFYPSSTTDFSNLSLDGADWHNPDREWSFRRTGLLPAIRASRLDDWYSEQTVNFHPGYLKLGQKGSNRKGFIITPEFPIADDKLAKVNVTLKVRKYDASAIGQYSVSVIRQLNVKNASTHESDFTWVVENAGDDDKLYQNVSVTALDSWGTYTVEGLYLQKGERIAFGTRKGADDDSDGTGKYRGMVAGVSVNAVSVDYPEIRVTLDEATSSTLSFRWTESNVDANKPDETALAYTASLYT